MENHHSALSRVIVAICALSFAGCPKDDSGGDGEAGKAGSSEASSSNGGRSGDSATARAGSGGGGADASACLHSSEKLSVGRNDKLDLLFMVDNSNSMAGEQAALAQQFPALIRALTTGMRTPDDPSPFAPVRDLHVGVVSSDMGIPGVEFGNCHADGGDDGRLLHEPHGAGCDAQYPTFLSFVPGNGDPSKFAQDVACISLLGTGGCGFEEQLEAPFKALWPSVYIDTQGNVTPNPYTFLSTSAAGTKGRGDVPASQGGNQGFLRNDVAQGSSVIAVVVVTDEEDCSVRATDHLRPSSMLPDGSPYKNEDINLRCYYHKELVFDVQSRYYNGFRKLRAGEEDKFVFAAIAGVPVDTVDADVLSRTDFSDATARAAFYDNILNDPRMQEVIDPSTNPGQGTGNLKPSCIRAVPNEATPSTAYPPRRIVELAKLFGENGMVQSICQDDFGPPMAALTNQLSKKFGERCLSKPLQRLASGQVGCDLVWELPKEGNAADGTPTDCDALPYLAPVSGSASYTNQAGGKNCKVKQLAVSGKSAPSGEGWYYDDFSDETATLCQHDRQQRIVFTSSAKPPTGVTVKLECQSPISMLASTAKGVALNQPGIGSECTNDAACAVIHTDGTTDTSLFCHPGYAACVRSCASNQDCPSGWSCDSSPEAMSATHGLAYCYSPKCSLGK